MPRSSLLQNGASNQKSKLSPRLLGKDNADNTVNPNTVMGWGLSPRVTALQEGLSSGVTAGRTALQHMSTHCTVNQQVNDPT